MGLQNRVRYSARFTGNPMRPNLKNSLFLLCCCALSGVCTSIVAQESKLPENRILLKAKHVYTGTGQVYSPGQVLVQDGKISYVGEKIELSLPAKEIEIDSVIPGLVNASTSIGLAGGTAEVSREITPDFDTYSAIDWHSVAFDQALDAGVTTIQVLPDTESVFCGFSCIVKTTGNPEERTLSTQDSVAIAVSSDPTSRNRSRTRPDSIYVRQPTNRMGVVWIIRNALHQSRVGGKILGADPNTTSILKSIVDGEQKVLSISRADFDIRSALELGELYGFQPTIYGGDEVYRMVDDFAASKASLVFTALTSTTANLRGNEGTELRWNVPGKLAEADISFCLGGNDLLEQARFAVRFGLSPEIALRSITLSPAEILGQQESIGSIEVGKDADLVALSGNPLQPTSAITWTMVNGKINGIDENSK